MKVDLLVIGGGPAGLSAAQYGARSALKTLCVEHTSFGGQALFINELENYPGIARAADASSASAATAAAAAYAVSGMDFADAMQKQAEAFGAILREAGVSSLKSTQSGLFEAALDDGLLVSAHAVILAMGAGHKLLGTEGESIFAGRGVSYCASCDGPFFKNKKIFAVGGGDAACTESEFLARVSPDVTILVRSGAFRAQKALVQRVLANKSIKVRYNTKVAAIKGDDRLRSLILEDTQSGAKIEEPADALFVFAGIVPRSDLVCGGVDGGLKVELDEGGFVKTGIKMETSFPGVFAAGDLRASPFRQVVTACADGAIAAHRAAEFIAALDAKRSVLPINKM